VPTIDDRVALLERQVSDVLPLRDAVSHLEHRMDGGFQAVDRRFEAIDRRFDTIDRRFDAIDRRFEGMERRMDNLAYKAWRQFMWLACVQVTTLIVIAAVLLARA
jgi:hypothetical protein